jgi:hypothetical protein
MTRAALALVSAGVTVQDILDGLPAAREEWMRARYGDAFVDDLERQHAALHRD